MSRFLTLLLLLLTSAAFCTERETIRDAHGKVVGTATKDGNRTIYRDASGKVTGTATTSGNRTVYRDASGKTVGTATESGNRTTYRCHGQDRRHRYRVWQPHDLPRRHREDRWHGDEFGERNHVPRCHQEDGRDEEVRFIESSRRLPFPQKTYMDYLLFRKTGYITRWAKKSFIGASGN